MKKNSSYAFEHIFTSEPSENELSEVLDECFKVKAEKNDFSSKIRFTFNKKVRILLLNRHYVDTKEIELKIFKAQNGRYCYTNYKNGRYGSYVYYLPTENLVSITMDDKETFDWDEKALKMKGMFHENLWNSLKEKLDGTYLKENLYRNTSMVNIKNKFPAYVINQLTEAIEEMKDYSYQTYGEKRDLSVQVSKGDDGELRAWFSSEYHGCANGDYWILVNPTTAMFRETD